MKAYILAVLIPCLAFAEEAVQLSFLSVKPVASVAPDAAAKVPDEAQNALKDAIRAKDWTNVVKSCDALLAIPGTATADRLAWTERRREAFERLGKWNDALAASMDALALPINSNAVHDVRMRVIRYLKDKLNRHEDAVRLGIEILDDDKAPFEVRKRISALVVDACKTLYRHEDARTLCLLYSNRMEAARISANLMDDGDTANRLFREVLVDESAPRADRIAAWRWFFCREPELADRYIPLVMGTTEAHTNAAVKLFSDMVAARGDSSYSFSGNYPAARRAYRILERIHEATGKVGTFPLAQYAAFAFCDAHDFAAAAKICRDAIEGGWTKEPAELYQLNLMATLLPLKGDETALLKAVRKADAKFAGELLPKTRVERIERVGTASVIGVREPLSRALAAFRKSLFVPAPKREYVVHYSETPIAGLAAWDKVVPKPEMQLMDRQFGGSMDFLATDVATGNRGEGIGTEEAAKDAAVPSIQIVCDAFGIHFRFEAPDEKALQMASGFLGGGSYEAYIAPGENEPYYCLLMDVSPNAGLSIFNTTYSTKGHRRIKNDDRSLYKAETTFTDHSAVSYIMLSWNAFATLIPENGTVWEFENVHWGRADKAAWNGTESIHGRSTWGRLVFDMPAKARIEILKRVIFAVRKSYLGAKGSGSMDVIDRWRDSALGDPAFYDECLAPLVAELDSYLPLVKVDMSDEDVIKVAEEALPRWRDIRFEVARLRARYLAAKLAE